MGYLISMYWVSPIHIYTHHRHHNHLATLCLHQKVRQLTSRFWSPCDEKRLVLKYRRSHRLEEINWTISEAHCSHGLSSVLWTVFQVGVTCRQAQSSDRPTDPHPAHRAARWQLERWAGTCSAETSRDFQEVQHQGSVCVIDLAQPPASMIPPARGSLTALVHICVKSVCRLSAL